MKTILCYGDSNTWGYDPRDLIENRYPAEIRWTDALSDRYRVLNLGLNGRTVLPSQWELSYLQEMLDRNAPDAVTVLLGSNDLLEGRSPRETGEAMKSLLLFLQQRPMTLLLLGLPPCRIPGLPEKIRETNLCYQALARELGISYLPLDALEIACDGVHLSEDGHRLLGRLAGAKLEALL